MFLTKHGDLIVLVDCVRGGAGKSVEISLLFGTKGPSHSIRQYITKYDPPTRQHSNWTAASGIPDRILYFPAISSYKKGTHLAQTLVPKKFSRLHQYLYLPEYVFEC